MVLVLISSGCCAQPLQSYVSSSLLHRYPFTGYRCSVLCDHILFFIFIKYHSIGYHHKDIINGTVTVGGPWLVTSAERHINHFGLFNNDDVGNSESSNYIGSTYYHQINSDGVAIQTGGSGYLYPREQSNYYGLFHIEDAGFFDDRHPEDPTWGSTE